MTVTKSSKIKMIFFDLGNVIVKFSHDLACQQMAKLAGVDATAVQKALFQDDLQNRYETGLLTSDQFHQAFEAALSVSTNQDELLRAGSDIFWFNSSMLPVIAQLGAAGFRIGILSNTCVAHWEFVLENFPIVKKYFPEAVLSFEVKAMKPAPEIYQAAIDLANCPPEELFFMDDRQENVDGAIAVGIDAVHYQSTVELYQQLLERGININL